MSANGALLVSWYTTKVDVKFTRAARKHKVGRERALQAMHNASYTGEILMGGDAKKILWLGHDNTGRALEIITVQDSPTQPIVVIHVMDLRSKYRHLYEQSEETT